MSFLIMPLLTALAFCAGACIALALLFYPKKPLSLGILTLQGVLPRHLSALIQTFINNIANDVSQTDWLEQNPDLKHTIETILDRRLDKLIVSIRQTIPLGEMFLTKTLTDNVKRHAKDELLKLIPELPALLTQNTSLTNIIESSISTKFSTTSSASTDPAMHALKRSLFLCTIYAAAIGFVIGLMI